MKDFMEGCLFYLISVPLVLMVCAVYWLCRLGGVDLNDEF